MIDDITYRPEQTDKGSQQLQRDELVREAEVVQETKTQMLAKGAETGTDDSSFPRVSALRGRGERDCRSGL